MIPFDTHGYQKTTDRRKSCAYDTAKTEYENISKATLGYPMRLYLFARMNAGNPADLYTAYKGSSLYPITGGGVMPISWYAGRDRL